MHTYVYCSYNESQNYYLNLKICYSNLKIDISILKTIILKKHLHISI